MSEISQSTFRLIRNHQAWYESLQSKGGAPVIHVDEVASRVASFYEKIRGVIEWREEHLLRKSAIERILRRRLLLKRSGEGVAEPLVYELIRGGHFPNDRIEELKISEVQKTIDKYVYILDNAPPGSGLEKQKVNLHNWLMGIAACEVEEKLQPSLKESAVMEYMYDVLKEKIVVKERIASGKGTTEMAEEDKNDQTYIAIQRALFRLDPPIICYNILKKKYQDWQSPSIETLNAVSSNIYEIWKKLEKSLEHPLADKFYKICERLDTPFLVVADIVTQEPLEAKKIIENSEIFEVKIRDAYKKRLKQVKARMKRAAIYSTISIFATKMIIAFALEIPFDKYVMHRLDQVPLILSVAIPPLLMLFLVLSIKPPSKQNEEKVLMEVMKIAYEMERKESYLIKRPRKPGVMLEGMLSIFYLCSFIISFGALIFGLRLLQFGISSQAIFIVFVSLISFAGVKIREKAKELVVEEEKETLVRSVIDFLSMPIIRLGRWLSGQWTKYNFLIVLFNSLFDMPFQLFVEFLEQWRSFLKEKKEEIH